MARWHGRLPAFSQAPGATKTIGCSSQCLEPLQMSTPQLESWEQNLESFESWKTSFQNLVMLSMNSAAPGTSQLNQKPPLTFFASSSIGFWLTLSWKSQVGTSSVEAILSVCLWEWGVCNCWQNFIDVLGITQWVFTV